MGTLDYSNCAISNKTYGGSERKIGIVFEGKDYIIKFPKNVNNAFTLSHISEYIGSQVFKMLGVRVHETRLGTYKGSEVVLLADFVPDSGRELVEFNNIGESSLETDKTQHSAYEYKEILYLLKKHKKLTDEDVELFFWKQFVVDALIANFDRHGYNWGFLKSPNTYSIAPVFDNGSSLFPRLSEKGLSDVVNDKTELDKRTFEFPMSQILLSGRKSSYYEVIRSREYDICTEATMWLKESFSFDTFERIVETTPFISEERKNFYNTIVRYRYDKIFGDFNNCKLCGKELLSTGQCSNFNCKGVVI